MVIKISVNRKETKLFVIRQKAAILIFSPWSYHLIETLVTLREVPRPIFNPWKVQRAAPPLLYECPNGEDKML